MLLVDYKKLLQKTGHIHEKSLFSVTLALGGQLKTLKELKNLFDFLKPISKGNFLLLLQ